MHAAVDLNLEQFAVAILAERGYRRFGGGDLLAETDAQREAEDVHLLQLRQTAFAQFDGQRLGQTLLVALDAEQGEVVLAIDAEHLSVEGAGVPGAALDDDVDLFGRTILGHNMPTTWALVRTRPDSTPKKPEPSAVVPSLSTTFK